MRLQYLEAGEIVNVHGLRGDVKILPWADSPEFLCQFSRVRISGKEYKVDNCSIQKTCNLVKLQGVDSVEQAQLLRGKTVEIFRDDAPEDLIFAAELIGMEVYTANIQIGKITDVLDYPGNKVYVVKGQKSYMIPAVKEFILSTDMETNRMQVKLIEGMAIDEN